MRDAEWNCLITDFCREVGIDDCEMVMRSSHIELDGMVVGLIPDESDDGPLSAYIDLGPIYDNAQRVCEDMLVANMAQRGDLTGSYGLHPTNGNAVFHMPLSMPLTGAELARRLRTAIDDIGEQFVSMQNH